MPDFEKKARKIVEQWRASGGDFSRNMKLSLASAIAAALKEAIDAETSRCISIAAEQLYFVSEDDFERLVSAIRSPKTESGK